MSLQSAPPKWPDMIPETNPGLSFVVKDTLRWMWQDLARELNGSVPVLPLTTSQTVNSPNQIITATGTITLTLPDVGQNLGLRFFFKNLGTGVITIAGTIDGNAGGYQLVNQYQYVQVVSNGSQWLVIGNN